MTVTDFRGQEITVGGHVVVPTFEGRLVERQVRAIETGQPGFVKIGPGDAGDQRAWMPVDRVAVVLPPFTVGSVPADTQMVVLRVDMDRASNDTIERIVTTAREAMPDQRVVVIGGEMWPIEWWSDEQLAQIGLQRIPGAPTRAAHVCGLWQEDVREVCEVCGFPASAHAPFNRKEEPT